VSVFHSDALVIRHTPNQKQQPEARVVEIYSVALKLRVERERLKENSACGYRYHDR
jgi:hypothetical protein